MRLLGPQINRDGRRTLYAFLSPREVEIVRLVASRLPNKAVGAELGITANTVTWNLHRIYEGLGIENRIELRLWWTANATLVDGGSPVEVDAHHDGCLCWFCEAA